MGDKTRRLGEVGLFVNSLEAEDRRVSNEAVTRAAVIAKADLASEMVKDGKEFTKLEGLIGSRYAREAKESDSC